MSPQSDTATTDAENSVESDLRTTPMAYQKVVLDSGEVVGGRFDRSSTADVIFPKDMTGETLLDIGTMEGFFPFEALRRGAKHVVGLDLNIDYVHNANLLAQKQGVSAEFHQLDIDLEAPQGQYDYVTFLNVLHHVVDPLEVLTKLIRVTRKKLVLEIAGLGKHERKKLKISGLANFFLKRLPLIYVARNAQTGSRQRFYVTQEAMVNILRHHRSVFARVDVVPSPFKDRYIAIAHRRRIGKLLVIGGHTACGKSTLIKSLRNGELPELARELGIEDPTAWQYLDLDGLRKSESIEMDRVVLEVDSLHRLKWNIDEHSKMEYSDYFASADEARIVTIGASQETLQKQLAESIEQLERESGRSLRDKRLIRIRGEYEHASMVAKYDRVWADYIAKCELPHSVVEPQNDYRLVSADEWMSKHGEQSA